MIIRLLMVLMAWAYVSATQAKEGWQHIKGLPCEETSSVIQDNEGYIWVGTRLGLVRYDGFNKNFYRNDMAHPHAFSSSDIKCLSCSADGRIFAGSFFGLNIFDKRTHDVRFEHFERNDYVRTVHYDQKGRLWIGTDDGLYLQEGGHESHLYKQIPQDLIQHIEESAEGEIIIATRSHGLFIIDEHEQCLAVKGTESISPTVTLSLDDGTVWVGTHSKGLYSLKNHQIDFHKGFDDFVINDLLLLPSNKGQLLVATNSGIISNPFNESEASLNGKNVQSLCLDRDGNVWAATENQGVYLLQNHKEQFTIINHPFTHRTTPIISQFDVRHLADTVIWKTLNHINAVYESPDGMVYIGTWDKGLYVTKGGMMKQHITKQNHTWLQDNSIYNISTLGKDEVLISTWHGLYLMDSRYNGTYIEHIGKSDVRGMHVLSATIPNEKEAWLGLVGGIAHIKGNLRNAETSEITIYSHVDRRGTLNPLSVSQLIDHHDDAGNYQLGGIFRIIKDSKGRVWACTSEPGLLLYDEQDDCFRCVSQQLGIQGDNVHSLDIDRHGNFWMTTNYGILQMSLNDDGESTKQQLYSLNDGLPTSYYGSSMSTLLEDGRLCILNQEQIITVHPSDKFGMSNEKKTYVSDIFINNIPLVDGDFSFDQAPPYTQYVELPHNQNNITFRFSMLSFGHEPSMRFSYKMEGVDNDTQQTEMGINQVRYNQLSPGTYRLYYSVYDKGKDNGVGGQYLTIRIKEPLWWCWWSKMLYAAIFLLTGYMIIHTIIDKNRRRQQLRFLELERDKQEEFYKKRMNFYQKALHEFLTPLTLMSEMIHGLHEKVRPSLQASLYMLSNQTDRLVDALNNLVDVKEDSAARDVLKKAQEMTQVDSDFLRKCTESVNNHISDVNYSHKIMMREVGASHATLYRKLKLLTGMDATSFIRSIRMKAACQILTYEPNIRVKELSERVGYNNPGYFSTCFKKELGMTPKEFVRDENETI